MKTNFDLNSIFSRSVSPVLFLDFDGTVSKRDVIDAILEEFADDRWLEVEQEWVDGKIGSRECLRRQFDLVRATPDELDEYLCGFGLDEGVTSILDLCSETCMRLHIVSDGFEYYIRRMLKKGIEDQQKVHNIGVWANELIPVGKNQWRTDFPHLRSVCSDGCATCKPAMMKMNDPFGAPTIFIGDGLSDRFAAETANIVYAKQKLAKFCERNKIPHIEYTNLNQVAESLREAMISLPAAFNGVFGELSISPA